MLILRSMKLQEPNTRVMSSAFTVKAKMPPLIEALATHQVVPIFQSKNEKYVQSASFQGFLPLAKNCCRNNKSGTKPINTKGVKLPVKGKLNMSRVLDRSARR